MATGDQIRFGIGFDPDKSGLDSIKAALSELQKMTTASFAASNPGKGFTQAKEELEEVRKTATKVEDALNKAFNPKLNNLNIQTFKKELGDLSVNKIAEDFHKAGVAGDNAFRALTGEVLKTNTQLKQSHAILDNLARTFTNTIKWNVASSAVNTFSRSVQQAYGYVKALDGSLNDIRIVTQKSSEEMAKFADSANNAAKNLGRTTTDYTDAALTFYQQGLDDETVKARTDLTLKVANASGLKAEDSAEYVTAVLNGYKVGSEEAEKAMDILANVGAHTASSLSELSEAMSKVSSTANAMGVSEEQLAASLATVIQTTRQDASQVGTAFKTIYMRISDIAAGTAEAETTLGNYTSKMASLGYNVLDGTGKLRDLGEVVEEIGGNWANMSREQQIALARTMAGTRQANNLLALFDNWNTYGDAIKYASEAEGTLQKQQDIYMESTQAHLNKMKASWEDLYDSILDAKTINSFADMIGGVGEGLSTFVDALGGGKEVLLDLGAVAVGVFSKQIASSLAITVSNIQNATTEAERLKQQFETAMQLKGNDQVDVKPIVDYAMGFQHQDMWSDEDKAYVDNLIEQKVQIEELKASWESVRQKAEEYYNAISGETLDLGDREKLEGEAENITATIEASLDPLRESKKSLVEINTLIAERKRLLAENTNDNGEVKQTEALVDNYEKLKLACEGYEAQVSQLKTTFDGSYDYLKKLNSAQFQNFENLMGQLKDGTQDWNKIFDTEEGQKTIRAFAMAFNNTANAIVEDAEKAKEGVQQAFDGTGDKIKEEARKIDEARKNVNERPDFIAQERIRGILDMTSGMAQLARGLTNLSNIGRIFNDEDLGTGEKLLQITITLSSSVGMLTMAYSKLQKTKLAEALVSLKAAAAETIQAIATGNLTLALELASAAAKEFLATIGPIGWAILLAGAIAGLVIAYQKLAKANNETSLDRAKKEAENAKQVFEDTTTAVEDLTSAWNELTSSKKSLEGLKKGTIEWYEALTKANAAVMKLIEKYPELADSVTTDINGVMSVSEEKVNKLMQKAVKDQQQALANYRMANAKAQAEEIRSQITSMRLRSQDMSRQGASVGGYGSGAQQPAALSAKSTQEIASSLSAKDLSALIAHSQNKDETSEAKKAYNTAYNNLKEAISKNNDSGLQNQAVLNEIANNTSLLYNLNDIKNLTEKANQIEKEGFISASKGFLENQSKSYNAIDNKVIETQIAEDMANRLNQYQTQAEEALNKRYASSDDIIKAYREANHIAEDQKIQAEVAKNWALTQEKMQLALNDTQALIAFVREMQTGAYLNGHNEEKTHGSLSSPQLTQSEGYERGAISDAVENFLLQAKISNIEPSGQGTQKSLPSLKPSDITDNDADFFDQFFNKKGEIDKTSEAFTALSESLGFLGKRADETANDILEQYKKLKDNGQITEESKAKANEENIKEQSSAVAAERGLDVDQVNDLAKAISKKAQAQKEDNDAAADSARVAAELAARDIEVNQAVEDLYDNYVDYKKVLDTLDKKGMSQVRSSTKLNKTYNQMIGTVSKLTGVSKDYLNTDFIKKHSKDIMKAAEGDEKAIERISRAAEQEVALNLDNDQALRNIDSTYNSVSDFVNNLPEGELTADQTQFLEDLLNAKLAAGATMDEIQAIMDNLNISADVTPIMGQLDDVVAQANRTGKAVVENGSFDAEANTVTTDNTEVKEDTGFTEKFNEVRQSYTSHVLETDETGNITPREVTSTYVGASKSVEEEPTTATDTKQSTVTAVKLKNANHTAGGNVSSSNKRKAPGGSGGGKKGRGKGGGKKRGKKGKGGGSKKAADPKTKDLNEDQINRYHDIDIQIAKLGRDYDKLTKAQDHLSGKELIKNLEKQLDLLKQQRKAYSDKIKLAKEEAEELRKSLKDFGASFDTSGQISNYASFLTKAQKELNDTISWYNKLSAAKQDDAAEKKVEDAQKKYDKIKDLVEKYDDVINETIPDLEEQIEDSLYSEIELRISEFDMEIQIRLDMSEAARSWNEFKRKVIYNLDEDDLQGEANQYRDDFLSYYNVKDTGVGSIQSEANRIEGILNELMTLDEGGHSDVYSAFDANTGTWIDDRKAAMDALKESYEELMSQLEDLEDLEDDLKDTFLKSIDAVNSAYDAQKDDYEFVASQIEHDITMMQLLYGEEAYDRMDKYYDKQISNTKEELAAQQSSMNYWKARLDAEQEAINAGGGNKEALEKYEENWKNAVSNVNSLLEGWMEQVTTKYENTIDNMIKYLNDKISNGLGLEYLDEQLNLLNTNSENYLDTINAAYSVQKLQNKWQDAIDNTDSITSQRLLNSLMQKQMDMLERKGKLTQYDIDRAEKEYEIALKQAALQETQQNKSKMRLKRDASGGYSYQFVSDEDAVRQAAQELADAQNDLYNFDKSAYQNNLNDMYSTWDEFQSKIAEAYKTYANDQDALQQHIMLLQEQYGERINYLTEQNLNLRNNVTESAFDDLANLYAEDVDRFRSMTEEEKDLIMNDLIPQWTSGVQAMIDTFSGEDGFEQVCKNTFEVLDDAAEDYIMTLDDIAATNEEVSTEAYEEGMDLIEVNEELIQTAQDEYDAIGMVIDQVSELIETYREAKTEAILATQAAYAYWQQEQAKNAKAAKTSGVAGAVNSKLSDDSESSSSGGTSSSNSGTSGNKQASTDIIKGIAAAIWCEENDGWGDDPERKRKLISKFNEETRNKIQTYINKHSDNGDIYRYWVNVLHRNAKAFHYNKFKEGGLATLTGPAWLDGTPDRPEIVLNAVDTKNILAAVESIRSVAKLISGNVTSSIANRIGAITGSGMTSNINSETFEQNVYITATFEGQTEAAQIQTALDNLVNIATQRAYRNRK